MKPSFLFTKGVVVSISRRDILLIIAGAFAGNVVRANLIMPSCMIKLLPIFMTDKNQLI